MPMKTIDTIFLRQESSSMHAVNLIHGFLPFVASLFFPVSTVALALCRRPGPVRQKPRRAIIALPIFFVLVTYSIDSLMLILLSFQGKIAGTLTSFLDNVFFSFSSSCSWFVLLSEFVFHRGCQTSLFPLGGYATLYLIAEALLFALCFQPATSLRIFDITRAIRLGALLVLLGITAISWISRARPKCMDEENVPLQNAFNRPHYGSTTRNNRVDSLSQKKSQSLIEYAISRVKRLAPLVWPKNRPYMLYFGVLFFLFLERLLIVIYPLQIGRITNIMANNGMFSWAEITMALSLTALASSEALLMAQSYLWFTIEERSDLELKGAVSDKALNAPNSLNEHANMDNPENLISHGKSIQKIFRSIFLAIIPMSADISLGVIVLYYMYGAYMAMVPTLVVVTSFWSFADFQIFWRRNNQELMVSSTRAKLVSQYSGFIWYTAPFSSHMPHQKTWYSSVARRTSTSSYYLSLLCIDTAFKSLFVMLVLIGGCMIVAVQVFMRLETVGSFVTLLIYLTRLGSNLRCFERGVHSIILGLIDTNNVHGLFDWTPDWTSDASDPTTKPPLRFEQGTIEFNNVHFAYNYRKMILKRVSFKVPGNTMVALVGATGSGKSTILDLLLDLYSPLQGSITIDGHSPHDSAKISLLANIGFVSQNSLLLHDTVLNNMLCGNPFASEKEVNEACKAVALHEKFNSLPRGYQTVLGEADVYLSSSELQRLALARVIIKNPKLIILDEATSDVDSNTEALIQRNLWEFCKDKTIIVVANRLSTVAKADKIIVLRHGRVCEQGTHASLLEVKGHYYHLWTQQSKTQETADLIDVNGSGPSKSTLKPEAPEFIPSARHVLETGDLPKQEDGEEHMDRNQAEEENETPQGMLDANNGRTQEPVENKKGSKRKHNRRVSSIIRQTSNSMVVAYPKKARKTTEDSKKRSLRRRRNESEPIG